MQSSLLDLTHNLFMILYVVLPPLGLAVAAIARIRAGRSGASGGSALGIAVSSGIMLGAGVTIGHALLAGAAVPIGQLLIAGYWAVGMLLLVRGGDVAVTVLFLALLRRRREPAPAIPPDMATPAVLPPPAPYRPRALTLLPLIRFALLAGVGFPFVVVTMICYRPHIVPPGDPGSRLGLDFNPVQFQSTDGLTLAGWWIPAGTGRFADGAPRWRGHRTVIICHGLWGGKAGPLPLARYYVAAGYNVLLFDFRGYGQSDGHLCSFGALEKRDVLGAVAYLHREHPGSSRRILGLGLDTGGAALLAAAADRSSDGQSIAGVAVIGCYDNLDELAHEFSESIFLPPLSSIVCKVGLPLGSLEVGADLARFRPGDAAHRIWPRPIMVIHGTDDAMVPFQQGQQLFDAATQPRRRFWLSGADADETASDPGVNAAVLHFFEQAEPIPVI